MTSRERVLTALSHHEPDRVPVDLNGTIVTSLTRIAYQNLRDFLSLPPDPKPEVSHFAMDTVRATDDLLDRYRVDTRAIGMGVPFGFKADTCLVVDIPGLGPFEGGCFLRGHDNFCADFYENPSYAEAVMDKVTDTMILFWDRILREVGESVQVVAQGDDVGMQEST